MEPEKPKPGPAPHLTPAGPQRSNKSSPAGSRGGGAYTQPPRAAKPNRRWLPIVALCAVLGAGGVGAHYYMSDHGRQMPISAPAPTAQKTLTLSGADLDEATTADAIAAINAGQDNNPLIAGLTVQQKKEIVDGQRKFYKLPVIPADAQHAPAAPAAEPHSGGAQHAAHKPQTETKRPTPTHVAPQATGPGDIVQIVLDGVVYGSYNVTTNPLTLDAPLKIGDVWSVSCLQLAAGKSSLTIGIGTVLNPVQTTLGVGQSTTFTVGPMTAAPDYAWFHAQAASGNPVAEYGLGHMYEYGIGEPRDINQAVHWYQLAANQHYLDAQQRLAELSR